MSHPAGLINSSVAGRTDRLPVRIPADSHVIPADVVSGLGQGNTMAGAEILDKMFGVTSGESPMAGMMSDGSPDGLARGGSTKPVPVIVAGGEYIVPPSQVKAIGSGSVSEGHRILDKMILSVRKQTAQHLKTLPGPKK